ncbi:MAG: glycosyltransferase family 2 protein [Bacteroidetes bacterium]|nr:glycosyltransferase family 2 protein [Bacteroidota bacterium]
MGHNNQNATAIVCAYNEEKTIGGILETLLKCAELKEIIVVNDGSNDGTSATLKEFANNPKVRIIEFPHNRGKGFAMAEAIVKAQSEILLFVDGDLLNFEKHYVLKLLDPLLEGKADMVIGHPTENMFDEKLNPFRPLAGERVVYRKDIFPLTEAIRNSRYGVETLINLYYSAQNLKVQYVSLWGLIHPIKFQKYPVRDAMQGYWKAASQIAMTTMKNYTLLFLIIRNIFGKFI